MWGDLAVIHGSSVLLPWRGESRGLEHTHLGSVFFFFFFFFECLSLNIRYRAQTFCLLPPPPLQTTNFDSHHRAAQCSSAKQMEPFERQTLRSVTALPMYVCNGGCFHFSAMSGALMSADV